MGLSQEFFMYLFFTIKVLFKAYFLFSMKI